MADSEYPLRLDAALVARGLSATRARARDQVLRGCVRVDGVVETRPARRIGGEARIALDDPASGYVSRAALKLIAGLDVAGFSVTGQDCLDVGASTGGFTQVLLERGAARVVALDVGSGQLAQNVRGDPRVMVMEGVNARDLGPGDLPFAPGLIVCDVSFISLRLVLPPVLALAATGACGVFLFKPQFEVGREAVGKGGIVRDADATRRAFAAVTETIAVAGWALAATCDAPIAGGDGNLERLIAATSTPAAR